MRNAGLIAAAVLAAAAGAACGQGVSARIVARTGASFPGLPAGRSLGSIGASPTDCPSMGPDGQVVFAGALLPDGAAAVCTISGGGGSLVALQGQPAPGGDTFGRFTYPMGLASGDAAFHADLSQSSTGGAYRQLNSVLVADVRSGDALPGLPPGMSFVHEQRFARSGDSWVFTGQYGSPGIWNGMGVWMAGPGPLALVARSGDPAPGLPGETFGGFAFQNEPPRIAHGEVAISAALASGGSGVWRGTPGAMRVVAATGLPAPTVPGGAFTSARNGQINAQGTVVFRAVVSDPSRPMGTGAGLWMERGGALTAIALPGRPAPGCGGALYSNVLSVPLFALGDLDSVVYCAALEGPGVTPGNTYGLFTGRVDAPRLIARTGDQAPGYPSGQTYLSFFQAAAVNSSGQVVWISRVAAPWPADSAVFAAGPQGPAYPALMGGQVIPGPQPEAAVNLSQPLQEPGGNNGLPMWLSEAGQFEVGAAWIGGNGSGIVVAQLPAPNTCPANCDGSTAPPLLNMNDFLCFMNSFAAGDPYANCDGSTTQPALNISDFICFLNKFAAGCP